MIRKKNRKNKERREKTQKKKKKRSLQLRVNMDIVLEYRVLSHMTFNTACQIVAVVAEAEAAAAAV